MSLLSKQALPHLNAGHYQAVILSYQEKTTTTTPAKEYVQVVLQLQAPQRPLTVNLFETSFEIALNALSRQANFTETKGAVEVLQHFQGNAFEITIEDTAEGYRNVHFYHKALTPATPATVDPADIEF